MQAKDGRDLSSADVSTRLHLAIDLARRARRDEALEQLTECEDWQQPYNEQGLLVRAEVLVRRDPILALETLAAHSESLLSDEARFGYFVTSAFAYVNTRNFDGAREMLAEAQEFVRNDVGRAARLAYERSRLQWSTRQYDPNGEDLAIALTDSDPAAQFRALALRSWMHAGLEDYTAQIADLLAAFRCFTEHGARCDITTVAIYLHALVRLAVELGDFEAIRAAEAAYQAVEWTSDIQDLQFMCVRALAWGAFHQGDPGRAQWLFKDSKELAPTVAWQVMAHVDRAYVARMNRNDAWAAEELAQARSIERSVKWDATHGEERQALVMLAELFAPTDMAQAQRYVSTYMQLGTDSINPTLAAAHERRFTAYEKYASGRVQSVLGNTKLATDSLEFAYQVFAQIHHAYRAALAAAALYELTKDPHWLEKARQQAAHFAKSPICQRLSELGNAEKKRVPSGLTPMQRQIAIALCQGIDLNDLSHQFSRSTFTLQKQIEIIFTELDVKSRDGLRSEMRRREIV